MRSNRKILFGVLILVAVFILFGLYSSLSNRASQQANVQSTPNPARLTSTAQSSEQVAYAAVNLPAHSIITRDMLKMAPRGGNNPATHITDIDTQGVGFVTRVAIPAGAAIEPSVDFVGHISDVGIAGALQPGTRAMVIPMANKPTLHDLIRIGNYVDVLAAFDGQEARTIVQGVRVLAVDIYGNQFPEKSIAMSGPFKTSGRDRDVTGAPVAASGPVETPGPDATPTPTPAPPANGVRPDPSITLEVTPEQAARIQLAQSKNASLEFLLLPALPGNATTDPVSNAPSTNVDGTLESPALVPVSVTSPQLAPYAERKKTPPASGGSASASSGASTVGGGRRSRGNDFVTPPLPSPRTTITTDTAPYNPPTMSMATPAPLAPPTYNIPIYADGKVVRNETVLTPPQ